MKFLNSVFFTNDFLSLVTYRKFIILLIHTNKNYSNKLLECYVIVMFCSKTIFSGQITIKVYFEFCVRVDGEDSLRWCGTK